VAEEQGAMPNIGGLGKFAGALRAYEAGLDIAKLLAAQDSKMPSSSALSDGARCGDSTANE
jgi:hypothetical protein